MTNKRIVLDEFHKIPLTDEEKETIKEDWQGREVVRVSTVETQRLSDFGAEDDNKGAE